MNNLLLIVGLVLAAVTVGYGLYVLLGGPRTCDECRKQNGRCQFIVDGANSKYVGCHKK